MSEKKSPARERGAEAWGDTAQANARISESTQPGAIHVELSGSDTAEACGYRVTCSSPVLALCRDLIEDGCGAHEPLEAYRGPVLCLSIGAIGQAARLRVNGAGTGFELLQTPPTAPLARAIAPEGTDLAPGDWIADSPPSPLRRAAA